MLNKGPNLKSKHWRSATFRREMLSFFSWKLPSSAVQLINAPRFIKPDTFIHYFSFITIYLTCKVISTLLGRDLRTFFLVSTMSLMKYCS